jgi:hypothetical protein
MGPQDEEDHAEENSPPLSRLLLAAPPLPPVPQRGMRQERAARLEGLPCRAIFTALQMLTHKFEQGIYTVTDVRWGMALNLSSADNQSLVAFGLHGWENQQVRTFQHFWLSLELVS